MSICPLSDPIFEIVFTDLREALILSISEISSSEEIMLFQSALALQCFTNEYIYSSTDQENEILYEIKMSIQRDLAKCNQPNQHLVLCVACYESLYDSGWARLLEMNDGYKEVILRQLIEPEKEMELKPDIPILKEIKNQVSSEVRSQYEENPYPRWVNLGLPPSSISISKVVSGLKLKLVDDAITKIEKPNILIAGCGTGQHSIGTAMRFKDCQVLAIDLSLSSLAYAKRKTLELGITNIKYMQADILDLRELDQKFDIVESGGVLHHMDKPMAGWRILVDCLNVGGIMNIGLYSDLARQHIINIREEIKKSGVISTSSTMKAFRKLLIASEEEHHKKLLQSSDFYSLSTFRDLVFHVQEHRFTLSQLKGCLSELGLEFCGFEVDNVVQNFNSKHTNFDDNFDLDRWDSYEKNNPSIFAGMYQFWCQKV
jgi:2-polyprenyl-3-methyl-5-hydroxy-6-metoxy-1,4-benzoquinol methylase